MMTEPLVALLCDGWATGLLGYWALFSKMMTTGLLWRRTGSNDDKCAPTTANGLLQRRMGYTMTTNDLYYYDDDYEWAQRQRRWRQQRPQIGFYDNDDDNKWASMTTTTTMIGLQQRRQRQTTGFFSNEDNGSDKWVSLTTKRWPKTRLYEGNI